MYSLEVNGRVAVGHTLTGSCHFDPLHNKSNSHISIAQLFQQQTLFFRDETRGNVNMRAAWEVPAICSVKVKLVGF